MNHSKITKLTRARAVELGLEPRFVEFLFSENRPECFEFWCEPADDGWTLHVPEEVQLAYPLWSCNADQTLLLWSTVESSYVQDWHDDWSVSPIARTEQGLLANLFNQIEEAGTPLPELRSAAEFSGFRFLDDYLEFIETPRPDLADWSADWERFVRVIDEKAR